MNGHRLMLLGAGFGIWASAFVLLYAMLSVGCRFGWHEMELAGGLTVQRAQLVAILLLHVAAAAALAIALRRRAGTFLPGAGYLAALAALAATIFTFAPIFALSPCS